MSLSIVVLFGLAVAFPLLSKEASRARTFSLIFARLSNLSAPLVQRARRVSPTVLYSMTVFWVLYLAVFVAVDTLTLSGFLLGEVRAEIKSETWLDEFFVPLVVFGALVSGVIMYRKDWKDLGSYEGNLLAPGSWRHFLIGLLKSIGARSLRRGLLLSLVVAYVIALASAFLLAHLKPPPLPKVEVSDIPQPESAQAVQEPDFQGKTLALLAHTDGHWYLIDEQVGNLLVVPEQSNKFIRLQLDQPEYLKGATMSDDGTIPAGRYVTTEFEPALSFSINAGWWLNSPETTDGLFIQNPEGELIFTSPLHVFDANNPSELKEVPAPENAKEWASWFQSHPNLDTAEPVPVSVGSRSGVQIDVTPSSTPENYPRDFCGEQPCVPLFPTSGSSAIFSYAESKDRFVIVDVGSETVVIDVAAQEDKFDEFVPAAQKVLDTVQWVGW